MAEISQIQSVERTFSVIELLCKYGCMSITDISKKSGLHKTTVFRILNTLINLGYAKKNNSDEKYGLSLKLIKITSGVRNDFDIRSFSAPYLKSLCHNCNETVHLVERDENNIVYIDKYESDDNSVRMASRIGLSLPMVCTAVGKAILAKSDDDTIKNIWENSEIIKKTEHTITDYNLFISEIEQIKISGIAFDNEENEIGVRCIAAALPDINGDYKYAVSISAPVTRFNDETVAKNALLLKKTCENIVSNM